MFVTLHVSRVQPSDLSKPTDRFDALLVKIPTRLCRNGCLLCPYTHMYFMYYMYTVTWKCQWPGLANTKLRKRRVVGDLRDLAAGPQPTGVCAGGGADSVPLGVSAGESPETQPHGMAREPRSSNGDRAVFPAACWEIEHPYAKRKKERKRILTSHQTET